MAQTERDNAVAGAPAVAPRLRAQRLASTGDHLFGQRRFGEALREFQTAARLWPENHEIHYRVAYSAWRSNQLHLVEPHLLQSVKLNPRFAPGHEILGQWYLFKAQYARAAAHSRVALDLEPNPGQMLSRAFVLAGMSDAQAAWSLLRPLLGHAEIAERVAILYAQIAPKVGQEEEAAGWVLRHLHTSGSPPPPERPQLHFVLATLLDKLGRFDEAFEQARAARRILDGSFDAAAHRQAVDRRISDFSADRLGHLPRATHDTRRPVFILGMPRSGTSLVEQILACHPQVFGAGELDDLARIAGKIDHAAPGVDDVSRSSVEYLLSIAARNHAARYVTDKMPANYLDLGLIELLFPQCHVIHCVRDPLDTCLSCYMTDFGAGIGFCKDQRTLGFYYGEYNRLMAHWKCVLGIPMLEVRYEDVVSDVEEQARRVLQFLELPWDDRCLRFHENKRAVATASREQVRRPLYASSVGRWRHYQKHIGELISALT